MQSSGEKVGFFFRRVAGRRLECINKRSHMSCNIDILHSCDIECSKCPLNIDFLIHP